MNRKLLSLIVTEKFYARGYSIMLSLLLYNQSTRARAGNSITQQQLANFAINLTINSPYSPVGEVSLLYISRCFKYFNGRNSPEIRSECREKRERGSLGLLWYSLCGCMCAKDLYSSSTIFILINRGWFS